MWRLKSFTFWINFALLMASLYEAPFLNTEMQKIVGSMALINLGLREKTQWENKKGRIKWQSILIWLWERAKKLRSS